MWQSIYIMKCKKVTKQYYDETIFVEKIKMSTQIYMLRKLLE